MSDWNNQELQEPGNRREGRSQVERTRFMARFTAVLLVLMTLSLLSLIPVYLELRSAPVVLDLGITVLAVVVLLVAHFSAVRQRLERSVYGVLFVALLMVVGIGVEQGAVMASAVPVLVGVFLAINALWPGKWLHWVVVLSVFALLFFGISQITLPITYNLAESESVGIRYGMIVVGSLIVLLLAVVRSVQRGSIRARLVISYTLLALLPVVLVSLAVDIIYVQRAREQIFAQLQSVATLKEEQILTWVEQLQSTLSIALDDEDRLGLVPFIVESETLPGEDGGDAEAAIFAQMKTRLVGVVNRTDLFEEIFILNGDGHVLISTDDEQVGKIQFSQTYFREGLQGTFFQPPVFFPSSGSVSMIVARPLTDANGAVVGVIAGRVSLEALNKIMLQRTGLGSSGETYLVGLNNALITESRFIASDTTIFVRTEGAFAAVARQENSQGAYDDYRGVPVVGVYRWLPDVQMALLAEQDQSEAFSAIQFTVAATIGFVFVTALVAVAVSLYISRSIASPVVMLAKVAQNVAQGQFEQDVQLERDDEIGLLADAFNSMTGQLRQLITGLEQRVAEQTRDLTLAAEVGQRVASERDLKTLLAAAVNLIQERFNLYHAQLYLVNNKENILVLQASTGQAGQELVRRGHRLAIGTGSINGTVAAERRPVIVSDTQDSLIFRPNPLLPATRSEMSVPLLVGERVVGVLDLQSSEPRALSEENLPAFQALAGQLAVAIDNAALFTEAEQTRLALEEQTRRLARENWNEYLDAISRDERIRYSYQAPPAVVLPDAEIPASHLVKVPIQITNQPIGFIEIEGAAADAWGSDKMDLVQEVATRVARQVENLRLFAEAEQYRLRAEEAVRRLTREGWESYQQTAPNQATGFVYNQNQVVPFSAQGEVDSHDEVYLQPLLIRGEPIGEVSLLGLDTPDAATAELLTAMAETLTTHIENLRLSEVTETALAETELQARRLAQLNEMSAQLNRVTTLDEMLHIILSQTPGLVDADGAGISLLTPDGEHHHVFIILNGVVTPVVSPQGTTIPLDGTSNKHVIASGRPNFVSDTRSSSDLDIQDMAQNGFLSVVQTPLLLGERVLGVLNVMSRQRTNAFSARDISLLQQVASIVATTLQNQRLFEETSKRAEREAQINAINQRIQNTTSVETALETATREIGQLLKARRVAVEINATQPNGS